MQKNIEHPALGVNVALIEPTQKALETYQENLLELTQNAKSAAVYNSSMMRAAFVAGILTGIEPDAIGDMKPAAVKFISQQVAVWVKECQDIPSL